MADSTVDATFDMNGLASRMERRRRWAVAVGCIGILALGLLFFVAALVRGHRVELDLLFISALGAAAILVGSGPLGQITQVPCSVTVGPGGVTWRLLDGREIRNDWSAWRGFIEIVRERPARRGDERRLRWFRAEFQTGRGFPSLRGDLETSEVERLIDAARTHGVRVFGPGESPGKHAPRVRAGSMIIGRMEWPE